MKLKALAEGAQIVRDGARQVTSAASDCYASRLDLRVPKGA